MATDTTTRQLISDPIDVTFAAAILNVTERSVLRYIAKGKLPANRIIQNNREVWQLSRQAVFDFGRQVGTAVGTHVGTRADTPQSESRKRESRDRGTRMSGAVREDKHSILLPVQVWEALNKDLEHFRQLTDRQLIIIGRQQLQLESNQEQLKQLQAATYINKEAHDRGVTDTPDSHADTSSVMSEEAEDPESAPTPAAAPPPRRRSVLERFLRGTLWVTLLTTLATQL